MKPKVSWLQIPTARAQSENKLRADEIKTADLRLGKLLHIGAQEQVAAVSIVGMPGGAHATAIAPQAFAALGKLGLRVISIAQTTSAYSVSFIISEDDVGRAVPFIHRELGL